MANLTIHRNVDTLHYHSSLTRIGDNIGESYVNHGVFDRLRRLREQAKAERAERTKIIKRARAAAMAKAMHRIEESAKEKAKVAAKFYEVALKKQKVLARREKLLEFAKEHADGFEKYKGFSLVPNQTVENERQILYFTDAGPILQESVFKYSFRELVQSSDAEIVVLSGHEEVLDDIRKFSGFVLSNEGKKQYVELTVRYGDYSFGADTITAADPLESDRSTLEACSVVDENGEVELVVDEKKKKEYLNMIKKQLTNARLKLHEDLEENKQMD